MLPQAAEFVPGKWRRAKMLKHLLDEHISADAANGQLLLNRAIEVRYIDFLGEHML